MYAIFVIVSLIVISFACRRGGARTPRPHAYTWIALGQNPEILFFFAPLWGGYEFICSFAPLGLEEQETDDERAAATANEG